LVPEIRVQLEHAPQVEAGKKQAASASQILETTPSRPVDLADAAYQALNAPLNYPPLAAGVVPGDHLAIAVDETVPQLVSILSGVIDAAEEAGIERHAISVILGDDRLLASLREELGNGEAGPQFVIHDPDDEQDLCLVARTESDEQLYVNRAIFEADIVLPIGCARLARAAGNGGVYDSLFPRTV
jgi:hypothetical protein